MRIVEAGIIKDKVKSLAINANVKIRSDVLRALKNAYEGEKNRLSRSAFKAIIDNAEIAFKNKLAICQDTGLPVVFVEIGSSVFINGNITKIITDAVAQGYREGFFRASIQKDPLNRNQKLSYGPAIMHTDIVTGGKIKITLLPKGFGSENKSKLKMFNPTSPLADIEEFIVEAVKAAGATACPPYIIGVGIGATADYAGLLAKKALLISINSVNKDKQLAVLEQRLLKKINKLRIGAFGFGGKFTALGIKVICAPTHIAGLPVAVNISCHALRSASVVI
ncbi:MAG: fumarate hydratase [Candidatus Omnitrophica bacterium]|nr:fumarate hydratase [Candidatus Omnitrophota bacterium]